MKNLPQFFMKDRELTDLSINENFAQIGIDSADIVGKTDYDFFPKETAEKYRAGRHKNHGKQRRSKRR